MFTPDATEQPSPAIQWLADTSEQDAINRWVGARRVHRQLADDVTDAARRADSLARLDASLRLIPEHPLP